jgi:uncharacterized protein YabN with tetrapyrrole methylase and pyrophosphatase domain
VEDNEHCESHAGALYKSRSSWPSVLDTSILSLRNIQKESRRPRAIRCRSDRHLLTIMHPPSQPQLLLIGLGVMIPDHITVQATRALSRCTHLYSIVQEPPPLWLPPNCVREITVVNVLKWYSESILRTENYDRVAESIMKEVSIGRTIGYVTYGNPMAYDRVAQNLVNYAKESNLGIEVVPGISSIDTIFCDLQVDMAPGVQVYEASWLFACQISPRIDFPLLLLQVGAFGSLRTHYSERPDGRTLTDLTDFLCRIYPKSHVVSLVRSTGHENHLASIRTLLLGNLCEATADELSGASLYISPVANAVPRQEIVTRMADA